MIRDCWLLLVVSCACGSTTDTAVRASAPPAQGPSKAELDARRERRERLEHDANVTNHRKLESASQDALASSCQDPIAWAKQHCTPSCYPAEPRDSRAGTKLTGPVVIEHRICQRASEADSFFVIDELDNGGLHARSHRGRFPKAHKKGSWQEDLAKWFSERQPRKVPRSDAVIVTGVWQTVQEPLTHESLRCVEIAHYTRAKHGKLDVCGATGATACEAIDNAAARGINLVQFRLAEARRLQAAGNEQGCQDAAIEAVAVGRGLPRWRQFQKINVGQWTEGLAYKTRWSGVLDEDQLFATAVTRAAEAEQLYAACGGARATTTPEQEQSFHRCP